MTKLKMLLLFCLLAGLLNAVTIYDIQYTTNAGNGTYPSPYAGQYVTVQGIVTAYGYSGSYGFYISMPEGGAWKGILVYNNTYTPIPGMLIEITGQVWEYYGLTEIRYVSAYTVISAGNPIPPAETVTTAQASSEAYEGVLVNIQNSVVTQVVNQYSEWAVSDGSGDCVIGDVFFDQASLGTLVSMGVLFESIKGIGHYGYGIYSINPRSPADILINAQSVVITLPTLHVPVDAQITVPVNVSNLTMAQGFQSYQFQLAYNPGIISYQSYSTAGTLSANGTVMATPATGHLSISFVTNGFLIGQGTLLNLSFNCLNDGVTELTSTNFTFNNTPVLIINQGLVNVGTSGGEVIDTLSVIQRPLLNIPAIVLPGETFNIECVAPQTTTNWTAQLVKGNLTANLTINNAQYAASPPRWILSALVPNVQVFELYDLKVTASGGISDRTRKSVQVLPTRKTSYYFAHITDLHLPTHIFYPDLGYNTDSTEVVDFREVIHDFNIIRPEFVLLTGDFINQGELEEFENMRVYTKAKRVLGEMEVPVYLVAGNHDIGGWPYTSPPAGSARKFWWKNFGWNWLDNTSTSWQYNTQDYSFDYGPLHFTGLEAYDNYDNYLPSIYGDNSFTNRQMQWLQMDLSASGAATKVLFHHYDFDDQLNLNSLGVNIALWGHIHYDSGSITATPYNLSTRAVCDGNRSYRIIRVNNTTVQPYATVNAGSTGNQVRISFSPDNFGYSNNVTATVVNNHPLSFEHALVKFNMPSGNADYIVTNGILEQVDRSGELNVCYVRINLASNSTVTVSIRDSSSSAEDNVVPVTALTFNSIYPNPFRNSATISITKAKSGYMSAKIFNTKGALIRTLHDGNTSSGNQYYTWDGSDAVGRICPAGIYFVKISDAAGSLSRKLILLK
ncbi:MAG: metallophosphoesterase [Candidatus Cloacimonetes bacterium]|nr:metallophosphoesterase [Candidatus Cloacimonadota bacterium]